MNPKQIKEREKLIKNLSSEIVEIVYEKQELIKVKGMAELARKNQLIHNTADASFMYKGVWYTYPHNMILPRRTKGMNRTLDVSLMHEAIDIIDDSNYTDKVSLAHIFSLVNNALELCRNMICLRKILPNQLWTEEIRMDADIYDIGNPLTEEEIQNFNNNNQLGFYALKRLMMLELILSKVAI